MAAASPEGRALYQATFANMLKVMNHREEDSSPPDVAAVVIVRAPTATAASPRTARCEIRASDNPAATASPRPASSDRRVAHSPL
jgi:hypothetical protein